MKETAAKQQRKKRSPAKGQPIEVEWSGVNALDLATIASMWMDGYRFCINDGAIMSLLVRTDAA